MLQNKHFYHTVEKNLENHYKHHIYAGKVDFCHHSYFIQLVAYTHSYTLHIYKQVYTLFAESSLPFSSSPLPSKWDYSHTNHIFY